MKKPTSILFPAYLEYDVNSNRAQFFQNFSATIEDLVEPGTNAKDQGKVRIAFVDTGLDTENIAVARTTLSEIALKKSIRTAFINGSQVECLTGLVVQLRTALAALGLDEDVVLSRFSKYSGIAPMMPVLQIVGSRAKLAVLHVHGPRMLAKSADQASTILKVLFRWAADVNCALLLTGNDIDVEFLRKRIHVKLANKRNKCHSQAPINQAVRTSITRPI